MQVKNSSQIHYSFTIAFGLKGQSFGAKFRGRHASSPPCLAPRPSTRPIVGTWSSQQGGRQDLLFRARVRTLKELGCVMKCTAQGLGIKLVIGNTFTIPINRKRYLEQLGAI